MFGRGMRIGVAVSGGADSVCLLHALLQLREEFALQLSVVHVNHNLRGSESDGDAQFVEDLAARLGLRCFARSVQLGGGNLEQEARRARYRFFEELIANREVQRVALGHTISDQAETVLFRLLRGAGSAGLAGIRPVTDSGIVRPLLQVKRTQVEGWLQERQIAWREDSSNLELGFDRNRIRQRLLPALSREWNPEITTVLAQTADWAYEEEEYWREEIPRLSADWLRFSGSAVILRIDSLIKLRPAVRRRLIRYVVSQVKGDLLGLSFEHTESVRMLAESLNGQGKLQIPGVEVTRSFDWLRFHRPAPPDRNWELLVGSRGCFRIPPDHKRVLSVNQMAPNGVYNRDVNALDAERTGDPAEVGWVLRNWRPGDRYERAGGSRADNIKDLFQEFRIPSWERPNWPVLTVGGSIAWVYMFGSAAPFAADAASGSAWLIRTEETES